MRAELLSICMLWHMHALVRTLCLSSNGNAPASVCAPTALFYVWSQAIFGFAMVLSANACMLTCVCVCVYVCVYVVAKLGMTDVIVTVQFCFYRGQTFVLLWEAHGKHCIRPAGPSGT